ncbi:MAG: tRNA pseudouridine(55) synthase TruB [Ruminococcus sp.]|nr:tRNA pseudouridine(55) synthase TruB [Ruminococcus sp.]
MDNEEISGVIAVYKPKGWTSFDVVAKLRGILRVRRIGHGGTLDPMAEGVLPVFVGKATKACDILPDVRKGYYAGFRLGLETDTQDITGEVLRESSADVTKDQLREAVSHYVGEIMQVPPMYSAVKVDGKKLYELAREGKTIERQARTVRVQKITIFDYDEPSRTGHLKILCEKGTYVRTIIHDMGRELGCGGVMTSLVRNYSAGIGVSECMRIEEIQGRFFSEGYEGVLMDLDRCFEVYKPLKFDENVTGLYKNGVKLRPEQVSVEPDSEETYRVYGYDGEFLGIGKMIGGEFRSVKNFFT